MRSSVGVDEGFDGLAGGDGLEGLVGLGEAVAVEFDVGPGFGALGVGHDLHAAVEMGEVGAPASADVEVFCVEVEVGVEGDVAVVGVLADDDDGSGVAGVAHGLHDGDGCAGGFDGDVGAPAGGVLEDPIASGGVVMVLEVEGVGGADGAGDVESRGLGADAENAEGAAHSGEDDGGQADGTAAEDEDGVAERNSGALNGVQGGGQSAAAGHEGFWFDAVESDATGVGLEIDFLGPTAGEPVGEAVGDAVDLAMRAAGGGACDEAVVAGVAGLVDVEEGDAVSLGEGPAVDVVESAADFLESADADVTWDEWVAYALESSLLEVDVCAADLAELDGEEGGAGFEVGLGDLANLDGCVRLGNDGGENVGQGGSFRWSSYERPRCSGGGSVAQ